MNATEIKQEKNLKTKKMNGVKLKNELYNAAALIDDLVNKTHFDDYEIEEIYETTNAIYETIKLIDELIADGTINK
jgi:hypothetical protein